MFSPSGTIVFHAEHHRLRRAVNVGVEHSRPVTRFGQGDGQIGRDGAFPYASLGRTDGHDPADAVVGAQRDRLSFVFFLRWGLLDEHRYFSGVLRIAGGDGFLAALADRLSERVARPGEDDRDADAFLVDTDTVDHTERHDVRLQFGMLHAVQHVQYFVFCHILSGCCIILAAKITLMEIIRKFTRKYPADRPLSRITNNR